MTDHSLCYTNGRGCVDKPPVTDKTDGGVPVVRYSMEEPSSGPMCYRMCEMKEDTEGEYVLATEYAALLARVEAAEGALSEAAMSLRTIASISGKNELMEDDWSDYEREAARVLVAYMRDAAKQAAP